MAHNRSKSADESPKTTSSDSVGQPSATYRFLGKLTALYSGSSSAVSEEIESASKAQRRTCSVGDVEDFDTSALYDEVQDNSRHGFLPRWENAKSESRSLCRDKEYAKPASSALMHHSENKRRCARRCFLIPIFLFSS
jgi:hypothetical protein